jgi:hypothetical protein
MLDIILEQQIPLCPLPQSAKKNLTAQIENVDIPVRKARGIGKIYIYINYCGE